MTTKLQMTRKMILAPIAMLLIGFMIQTSAVQAQSRGGTSGRQSKTEKTERKSSSATKKKSTSQSSARGSSRKRATPSSNSSSSKAKQSSSRSPSRASQRNSPATSNANSRTRTSNQRSSQSSRNGSANNSRTQKNNGSSATRGGSNGGNSRANSSRQSNAGRSTNTGRAGSNRSSRTENSSSSKVRERATSSSRVRDGQQDKSGRAGESRTGNTQSSGTSTRNTRTSNTGRSGSSTRTDDRRRSGNNGDANNRRQPDAGRATNNGRASSNSGTRGSNASTGRSRRSGNTVQDSRSRQSTRVVNNNGRRSSSGRGTVNDRSNERRVDNRRSGVRRDATGVRILPAERHGWRNSRDHYVYKNRNWRYKSNRVYVNPVYHHRPHVQVNVVWPWQNRYRRSWRPSYRYCQVVYVETGWRGQRNRSKVDIRTNYHHEVRYADHNKALVDIYIDEIEVYENGYFLGKVRRFPKDLRHIEATIYRSGEVVYDRDVFIVGDPYVGFEMIATQAYDGYVYDHYDRTHGMDVGKLNFRRKRVDSRRYSKLFDPYGYNGYAPISVLPDDEQLLDYGYDAISYHHYDDNYDPYYGGSYNDDYYDYDDYGNYDIYNAPRRSTSGSHGGTYGLKPGQDYVTEAQPLTLNRTHEYKTNRGLAVKLQREATLERIK